MQEIKPSVVILASRYDFTCDYVVSRLRSRGVSYLRLNSEDLTSLGLNLDPLAPRLDGRADGFSFSVTPQDLRAIFFRRPVFLRETDSSPRTPEEQFERSQWAAFMRSFMVFDNCRWMNHPTATYKAENKAIQLLYASRTGLKVPATLITNTIDRLGTVTEGSAIAVKGLETVLVRDRDFETFGYTSLIEPDVIGSSEISSSPMVAQQALQHKLDLRVTVVDQDVFCAAVTESGKPIYGDWRLRKNDAAFSEFELPSEISSLCVKLVKHLGLTFGAIDLAFQDGQYFFLEINPTGEWAWLLREPGFPIDEAIERYLTWVE